MKTRTLAAAALALGLSACSAEFSPVAIFSICAPPDPDTTNGSCVYPASCDNTLAGNPVLDVGNATVDFRLPVELQNTLKDNSSTLDGRINTNDAFVQSWEMTYSGADLPPWSVAGAVTVPAAGTGSAVLRLIPSSYFTSILPPGAARLSLIVKVRGHGVLTSQDSFTTAWFQIPVEVCAGCLDALTCPAGTILASCPPAPGAQNPGQTASVACLVPAQ
ncbi:MAG: hypothetical protein WB493_17300 [Anaeromyxobacteraceae bacterium]